MGQGIKLLVWAKGIAVYKYVFSAGTRVLHRHKSKLLLDNKHSHFLGTFGSLWDFQVAGGVCLGKGGILHFIHLTKHKDVNTYFSDLDNVRRRFWQRPHSTSAQMEVVIVCRQCSPCPLCHKQLLWVPCLKKGDWWPHLWYQRTARCAGAHPNVFLFLPEDGTPWQDSLCF